MKVAIQKARGRVYYDPETGYLRLDVNGVGLAVELTPDERLKLSRAIWYSAAR